MRRARELCAPCAPLAAWLLTVLIPALLVCTPAYAANVQIFGLSDVSFGTLSSVSADVTSSQSVCAYAGLLGGRYSITASGSGSNGAFTLTNGSALLPYEVQWAGTSGQATGTALTANAALSGQTTLLNCLLGLTTDASLIVILRGTSLSAATAGSYSGTLTLLIAPN